MAIQTKRKNKRTWLRAVITILILAIIGTALFFYLTYKRQQAAIQALSDLQTVEYQKGSLSASISGTGTVRSNQLAMLTWSTSGTVGQVNVTLGQEIKKGDILMSLDEENLPIDILQAQIDVINIQNALDDLYEVSDLEIAQADLDLIKANQALDDAIQNRKVMDYGRCTNERIEELQEDYDDAFEAHDRFPTDATLKAVDIALANLNFCKADFTVDEISEADAKVRLASEKVQDLEAKIETYKNGPDPDDVTVLETQLAIAEARLAKKYVTAPFDSVVTGQYSLIGDQVTTGQRAIQLADLSKLFIDVQISEVDIPLVMVGQKTEMVFDAYFTDTFPGVVEEISPTGTELQGVVTYNVTVRLLDGLDKIKSGMTAAVNMITEEKTDVFIIPVAALTTRDGQDIVYVMRNGVPEAVEVIVGAFSDNSIEIIEGNIQEGEIIVINPPTSILSMMSDSSSMPNMFRGR